MIVYKDTLIPSIKLHVDHWLFNLSKPNNIVRNSEAQVTSSHLDNSYKLKITHVDFRCKMNYHNLPTIIAYAERYIS